MIVVRMQGGLGNQFFQYACGRALSGRLRCPLWLDLSWFRRLPKAATPRAFELGRYPIRASILDPDRTGGVRFYSAERLGCLARIDGTWTWARPFRERSLDFDERISGVQAPRTLEGYWQSPRYFDGLRDTLWNELQPDVPLSEADSRVAALIRQSGNQAVSVHVRRGDYLVGVHATHHGVCEETYYSRALSHLRGEMGALRLFVFSDDPEWVQGRSDLFGDATVVSHNRGLTAFQDLRLMSMCRGHVIANSSFSWWGAWLSRASDKKVIAPLQWLRDGRALPDLIPRDWVRL